MAASRSCCAKRNQTPSHPHLRVRTPQTFFITLLVLEKALYELGYDLNSRPDWVLVPLISILRLLRDEE